MTPDIRADDGGRVRLTLETTPARDVRLRVSSGDHEREFVIEGMKAAEWLVPAPPNRPGHAGVGTRQNRDDAIATLVAEYLHDVRNQLTVAKGRLELATAAHEIEDLDAVEVALDRMHHLAEELFTVAYRVGPIGPRNPIDVGDLARGAWEPVASEEATLQVEGDLGTVSADEAQVRRLFENLYQNAIQHNEAPVTVRVGRLEGGPGFFVADNGVGLSDTLVDAIFDPWVSGPSGGTGLGLAIVHGVVEWHGWELVVEPGTAGGARFEVHTSNTGT